MTSRQTWVDRKAVAGCHQCEGMEPMWTDENCQGVAARHHDETGHTTWVMTTMNITYGSLEGRTATFGEIAAHRRKSSRREGECTLSTSASPRSTQPSDPDSPNLPPESPSSNSPQAE